ncbi:AAA family ATPase [Acidianus ambivalens]|uniref:AAA family ATPase n=1 Tax=Acidianus ambivalens TaxID=2283 RepID=UPI001E459A84|nr:AAA family ATPase [Acidianus ambivalens]
MEILRREYNDVKNFSSWTLVYGRRKVGKSFLVRKYVNYNLYYVITRDLQAYFPADNSFRNLNEVFSLTIKTLRENKTVVIDEFQRMPEKYWDALSVEHPNGKLILVGSSFRIMQKLVDK